MTVNRIRIGVFVLAIVVIAALVLLPRASGAQGDKGPSLMMPRGGALTIPRIDAANGRRVFVNKGCVVCHAVNGVGGSTGPALDARIPASYVGLMDFAARMWRGAEAMIALQKQDLGFRIELSGEEIGDLTAFANDIDEQLKLHDRDIPEFILRLMRERNL